MSGRPRDVGPHWRRLPDDERLHARHGPIDLIVSVTGSDAARRRAERAAHAAFAPVLTTLVSELGELRRPLDGRPHRLDGEVARRMLAAVAPYRAHAITPMAAVAGAVADHVLAAMRSAASPRRCYVNNGGDVALHVGPGETLRVGVHDGCDDGTHRSSVLVEAGSGIGGVATSGRGGRSHSLGVADAVTVLAASASAADAAATVIANAIDLPGSDRVTRVPARELSPDSDLGDRLVTVDVASLDGHERAVALASGVALARRLLGKGAIVGARLVVQSEVVVVEVPPHPSAGGETARLSRFA